MKLVDKEKKALTGSDIIGLVGGKTKIIKYSELADYNDIGDVLFGYNSCVILIMTKANFGHWVCLTRRGNILEFFDSYGHFIDDPIYFRQNTAYFRKINNQDYPLLTGLLLNSECNYEITYNELPFQKKGDDTATCGRHVACRIMNKNLDLYDYYKKLKKVNPDLDIAVVLLTHSV